MKIRKRKKEKIRKHFTEKQKKLIKIISENINSRGFTKTMKDMMLEAGYSESMAKRQVATRESIKEETEPIVEALIAERDAAIEAMKSKRGKAKYRDLADAIDKLTKNIQLLGGKPTENLEIIKGFDYIRPKQNKKIQKD